MKVSKSNFIKHMKRRRSLIRPIGILLIIGSVFWLVYLFYSAKKGEGQFRIENTPMHIEHIRNIANLATISYKDEVVIDSLEHYQSTTEQFAGNLLKFKDIDKLKHAIQDPNIKRRITLIVQGEIYFGFDLKDDLFDVREKGDSLIIVTLPKPKILDIVTTPSGTRIFQEQGTWNDFEISTLKRKSKTKMRVNFNKLNLDNQAQMNIERIIKQLLAQDKIIQFEYQ